MKTTFNLTTSWCDLDRFSDRQALVDLMNGFDGVELGEFFVPRLASISQNVTELADRSFRILLENIEDHVSAHYEIVPVTLEDRESARRIKYIS